MNRSCFTHILFSKLNEILPSISKKNYQFFYQTTESGVETAEPAFTSTPPGSGNNFIDIFKLDLKRKASSFLITFFYKQPTLVACTAFSV